MLFLFLIVQTVLSTLFFVFVFYNCYALDPLILIIERVSTFLLVQTLTFYALSDL